jgi:hypothetical protein
MLFQTQEETPSRAFPWRFHGFPWRRIDFSDSQSASGALSYFPVATVTKHVLATKISNETAAFQHRANAKPDEPRSGK